MSKRINWIKLSSRRTDQTTENNSQEMAACLLSRNRRNKGHEQELREELLQSPRIGIENYPSRKAFATHSSTFSGLTNGFSRKYATLSHARFMEKGRHKNIKAAVTVARMKFLLNFQTQKTTQERIIVENFFLSARLQVQQPSLLHIHDTVHAIISVIHEKVYDKIQREVSKKKLGSLTSVAAVLESQSPKLEDERDEVFYADLVATPPN